MANKTGELERAARATGATDLPENEVGLLTVIADALESGGGSGGGLSPSDQEKCDAILLKANEFGISREVLNVGAGTTSSSIRLDAGSGASQFVGAIDGVENVWSLGNYPADTTGHADDVVLYSYKKGIVFEPQTDGKVRIKRGDTYFDIEAEIAKAAGTGGTGTVTAGPAGPAGPRGPRGAKGAAATIDWADAAAVTAGTAHKAIDAAILKTTIESIITPATVADDADLATLITKLKEVGIIN